MKCILYKKTSLTGNYLIRHNAVAMRVGLLIVLLQCSTLSFGKVVKLAPLETEGGHLGSEAEHVHGMVGSSEEDDSSGDGSAVLR